MKVLIFLIASLQLISQEELFEFNHRAYPGRSAAYGDTIITNYQSENLFLSYDGGKSWDTLNVNTDLSCREIIKKDNDLYLLSGDGTLLKINLLTMEVDDIAPIFDDYPSMNAACSMLIKDNLIIIGKNKGTIEISKDAGETWEERKLHDDDINKITFHNNKLYLSLENSYKDHTLAEYDLEKNKLTPRSRFYNAIWKLESIDNKLFVCGSDGLLAYSDNGGKSWKHFNTKIPWSINKIKYYDNNLYAIGGFDETYLMKVDLENNTISEPKMIIESGSYMMDISDNKFYLWRRKPDKLLAFDLYELIK